MKAYVVALVIALALALPVRWLLNRKENARIAALEKQVASGKPVEGPVLEASARPVPLELRGLFAVGVTLYAVWSDGAVELASAGRLDSSLGGVSWAMRAGKRYVLRRAQTATLELSPSQAGSTGVSWRGAASPAVEGSATKETK